MEAQSESKQREAVLIAGSVVVYCLSVSAVPIYNKAVFRSGIGGAAYPYPIAAAFLQLGASAAVLLLANVVAHLRGRPGSWVGGPHFWYKVRHVAPVGLLFGVKYGITNWGLQLVPTGTHLLLQSSDLLWTVAAARLLNKERLGLWQFVAAVLSTAGSLLIAAHANDVLEAPFVPLLVNLLTPLVLALCISTLRAGTKELLREDNRLGGMSATEFTALKLAFSAAVALALAMALENGHVHFAKFKPTPWWTALAAMSPAGVFFTLLGGLWVLIFQLNITWLANLTSAVTVGIVGGLKVVPQWILNACFQLGVDLNGFNLGGAALILCASALYAWAQWQDSRRDLKLKEGQEPLV